jgi:hypothetical protein
MAIKSSMLRFKEDGFKKSAIRSAIEFFINSLLMSKITQNTQGFDFRLF